jgi:hypothetical protein
MKALNLPTPMNATAAAAEKVLEFDLMAITPLAKINDDTITIECDRMGFGFNFLLEEWLLDIFETRYCGQKIIVNVADGENIEHRGILNFFENLCQQGIIPRSAVVFYSHHQKWDYNFKHKKLSFFYIFDETKKLFEHNFESAVVDVDAKFIGCLIGKFTPNRFNLAYQLDCSFPNDNFLTFRPSMDEINNHHLLIDGAYGPEFDWVKSKTFDTDTTLSEIGHATGALDHRQSTPTYHMLWPKFQIECVAETDVFSDSWFTEKTARCLASGKPFVLFSGPGSLKTLQKFGFRTYNDVIDESYDTQLSARSRMTAMLQSLKDLYNDSDRVTKINQLNQIAKYNQLIYDKICKKI